MTMTTDTTYHEGHDHSDGLHDDLVKLATRRDALRIFGVGTAAAILSTLLYPLLGLRLRRGRSTEELEPEREDRAPERAATVV